MKMSLVIVICCCVSYFAVGNSEQIRSEFIAALSNTATLTNELFYSRVTNLCTNVSVNERAPLSIMKSVCEYQLFQDSGDKTWAIESANTLSNCVEDIRGATNSLYWGVSQVLYGGSRAMLMDYVASFSVCTNCLARQGVDLDDGQEGDFVRQVFHYYKMTGLNVRAAAKYVAGMSAAASGWNGVATNFAFQLDAPYRQEILEFVE